MELLGKRWTFAHGVVHGLSLKTVKQKKNVPSFIHYFLWLFIIYWKIDSFRLRARAMPFQGSECPNSPRRITS